MLEKQQNFLQKKRKNKRIRNIFILLRSRATNRLDIRVKRNIRATLISWWIHSACTQSFRRERAINCILFCNYCYCCIVYEFSSFLSFSVLYSILQYFFHVAPPPFILFVTLLTRREYMCVYVCMYERSRKNKKGKPHADVLQEKIFWIKTDNRGWEREIEREIYACMCAWKRVVRKKM